MRRWTICAIGGSTVGMLACLLWLPSLLGEKPGPAPAPAAAKARPAPKLGHKSEDPDKLPEATPPPGLPIVAWTARDHFPIIRKPWYVPAKQADLLMALEEPVLGVVLDGQARAYSTNQLNEHEVVIDEIAGIPVLVTY
jgi:hypothetical protein